ncbi:MAG: Integral membrane sensor signal transduction histidine kinase [candidate division WS6 bacterium GW2011_GWF2_39_15]|uniref:histidine kinase n=1 Tax=candidate division WS6 bacterium GW2011_GWF2_39_15 TaxID=1619100 RepID=A0A0G0MSW1_9BACT|nr:MAG: Integral membrane sensor signal transduction histidine kinase [candidate division WS6 bacterium GW2011_GWF2_39_15]
MGVIKDYIHGLKLIKRKWDFQCDETRDKITTVLFLPILLVFTAMLLTILAGVVVGRVLLIDLFKDLPFIIVMIVTTMLFFKQRFELVRYFLITLFGLVAIYCFLGWGILHYVGLIFSFLFLFMVYFTSNKKVSRNTTLVFLLGFIVIGLSQSFNIVKYESSWSPKVFIFDFIIVLISFLTIIHVAWIYNINSENQIMKIREIISKLKKNNESLENEVVKKTLKLMKNDLELEKSQKILSSAYEQLGESEKSRFEQMNKLANTAFSISKRVHNIKSPLMFALNIVKDMKNEKKGVNNLIHALLEIRNELDIIHDDTVISGVMQEFSVAKAVKRCIQVLQWKLNKYKVKLSFDDSGIFLLNGDMTKFNHVILNLIDNAIDATLKKKNPQIQVTVYYKDDILRIVIQDNGMGIMKADIKKIFKDFYTTKKDGNGLGLYIAQKYISEVWGGKVYYKRQKKWSNFIVEIPT